MTGCSSSTHHKITPSHVRAHAPHLIRKPQLLARPSTPIHPPSSAYLPFTMFALRTATRAVARAARPAAMVAARPMSTAVISAASRTSFVPFVATAGVTAFLAYGMSNAHAASVNYDEVRDRHGRRWACARHRCRSAMRIYMPLTCPLCASRFALRSPISSSLRRTTTMVASAPCSCAWHGTRPARTTCSARPAAATEPRCASTRSATMVPTLVCCL